MIELEHQETIFLEDQQVDLWSIILDDEQVGSLQVAFINDYTLGVEDIFVKKEFRNQIGPRGVRRILQILKNEYPSITVIAGVRISGVRARGAPVSDITGVAELPTDTAPLVRVRI